MMSSRELGGCPVDTTYADDRARAAEEIPCASGEVSENADAMRCNDKRWRLNRNLEWRN